MGQKICMNAFCATTSTVEWKKGWPLRSGGATDLCFRCGSAYETSLFCDTFHKEQSGWRECYLCHKRLHCGCIASKNTVELLDIGGVACSNCYNSSLNMGNENQNLLGRLTMILSERQPINGGLSQLCQIAEANEPRNDSQNLIGGGDRREEFLMPRCGFGQLLKPDSSRPGMDAGDMHEPPSKPSLTMSLGVTPVGPYLSRGILDRRKHNIASQLHRSASVLSKPSKSVIGTSKAGSSPSQMRTVKPPVEGRGKSHLLPRYWPKITDQELQQISGNLNSKIVPLFEKVLSASDAGRIGRLVLPKACAEAYFPSINQSEGIPLKIRDVKGKEWTFQFRFWPNNNSRMYVLEGVTPCIQSMQLQAGDTVIFSRIDPDGKLVMGFRKTVNAGEQQGSGLNSGASAEDTSSSGVTENLSSINGSLIRLQKPKEAKGLLAENLSSPDGDINEGRKKTSEKKKTRNIGKKNKRLVLNNEESLELRLTWEEAQDLLRPPLTAKPTIVTVDEHEFEEYDEPPVFGKKTIFTSHPSGRQEQWAQCDVCFKWRRLPENAYLSSRWTCFDNVWDVDRCSCLASEENLEELESFLRVGRENKKRKREEKEIKEGEEALGLDALANAAALGANLVDAPEVAATTGADLVDGAEVATTTRHPRHRPGCSCIVCIQPPSGKGKHKPNCGCSVCVTVKRRFKTLMLRKKKKQLEREGAVAAEENEEAEQPVEPESEIEGSSGNIDLNSNPYNNREDMETQPEEEKDAGETMAAGL